MNNILFIKKYQPENIEDFNLNPKLLNIINTFIELDNINIILVGDSGCGKSTLIEAIIKKYYQGIKPCSYKQNILYVNNLNGNGLEYYRNDVKTFCQTHSSISKKKKVVVLDDIDFINDQLQQVLRNIIDKYSSSIHFIASCSSIQKIIINLQSRFNLLKIPSINRDDMIRIMDKIVESENIVIEPMVKEQLLNISNNTIKTLINYLEKIKLVNKCVTMNMLEKICTNISFTLLDEYTSLIKQKQLKEAIRLVQSLYDIGYSVVDILDNYFFYIKYTNTVSDNEKYKIIPYICKYITIFNDIHEDEIELSLFTNNLINVLT